MLNYPADSQGNVCMFKYSQTYPLLFIDLSTSTVQYKCVDQCPNSATGYTAMDSNGAYVTVIGSNQHPNAALGGVCWSSNLASVVKRRNIYYILQEKMFVLSKFKAIELLVMGVVVLGIASGVLGLLLPAALMSYGSIILAFIFLAGLITYVNMSALFYYRIEITIVLSIFFLMVVLNILLFKERLTDSLKFTSKIRLSVLNSTSFCSNILKIYWLPLVYTFVHILLLLLIVAQYLALVSSETLVHNSSSIYYMTKAVLWKYLLLLV